LKIKDYVSGFNQRPVAQAKRDIAWATSRQHWARGFDKKTPSVVET
jgi:hypothetical protein